MTTSLPSENSQALIPIHVLTGFLGSGKTTLLNRLLRDESMQHTAVIINEVGEIGIDHMLVESTTEDMLMLAGSCLCCAVRGDLVRTLENLYLKQQQGRINRFERVVIETSGLADPAPVLRTLINDDFVVQHYRLDVVVTTVDAIHAHDQLNEYDESVKQAALANQLVLTKTEQAHDVDALKQRLRNFNPVAPIHDDREMPTADELLASNHYRDDNQQLDISRWLQPERYQREALATHEHTHGEHGHTHGEGHDAYIRTFCLEHEAPLSWQVLERWINQMTRLRGKDLLRVKGIAYTQETDLPVVIQGVQHIFQPPTTLKAWPDEKRLSRIVFITRNIEQATLEASLNALIKSKTPLEASQAAMLLL